MLSTASRAAPFARVASRDVRAASVVLATAFAFALGAIVVVHGFHLDVLLVGEDAANPVEHQRARAADFATCGFQTIHRLQQHRLIGLGILNHLRDFFFAPIDRLLLGAKHGLGGLVDAFDAGDLFFGEDQFLLEPLGLPPLEILGECRGGHRLHNQRQDQTNE